MDVVAHSMGGLVARWYIEQLGGEESVHSLVTLGTPHHGTGLGIFARGVVAEQMLPGSTFLKTLADSLPAEPKVLYHSIAGELDTVVFPIERTMLPLPHKHTILKSLGHNSILLHGQAFLAIRAALLPQSVAQGELTTVPQELDSEKGLTLDGLLTAGPSSLETELLGEKVTST